MNRKSIAAFVSAVAGIGVISYYMAVVFAEYKDRLLSGAVVMCIEILVLLLIGAITISAKQTKDIGQGIFIGTGLTALIGFAICSAV